MHFGLKDTDIPLPPLGGPHPLQFIPHHDYSASDSTAVPAIAKKSKGKSKGKVKPQVSVLPPWEDPAFKSLDDIAYVMIEYCCSEKVPFVTKDSTQSMESVSC